MNDKKFDSGILIALFKRKGATSQNTGVFSEISNERILYINSKIRLHTDESAAICGVIEFKTWFLITNTRIIICLNDLINEIKLSDIESAVVNLENVRTSGSSLSKWQQIILRLFSGEMFTLDVEEGLPMGGVWSVLAYVAERNRHQ